MNTKQRLTELLRTKIISRLNEMNGPGGREPIEADMGPSRLDLFRYDPEAKLSQRGGPSRFEYPGDFVSDESPIHKEIGEILSTGSVKEAIEALQNPASGRETLVTAFLHPNPEVHKAALQHPTFGHPDHIEAALAAGVDEKAIQEVLEAQQKRAREEHQDDQSLRHDYL